ncbi:MAG TPA: AAA family ATPase [Thermoplasmata archaeon]|nr:AAA family ATPase [Thermoplasmata archaeon]
MVRRYVRKRTFTTRDRVLIHLSTDALRPEEQTQEGIAAATRSGRSTLTKWLDRLERRGLVTRDRIRLPGHPLPKYAYRLREAGWRTASALRQELTSQVVTVRVPSLGELSVRISEVPNLASAQLDLTAALASVRKGRLDLGKAPVSGKSRGPVVWGSGLRRVDRFFGREAEFRDLDAWWATGSRMLLVTGLAGIGKSALVATWAQGRGLGVPVYGFEAHRSSTPAGLLSDFGAFLAALGKPTLAAHLSQGVPLDPAFIARVLKRDLDEGPILVVLDNADQASRDLARLISSLFAGTNAQFACRVILIGRRFPKWLSHRSRRTSLLDARQVQGLDSSASRTLLRSRGLGPESNLADEIIRKTRGHPLLLHLAASTGTGRGSVVQRYLRDEVWDSLSTKDRSVLEAASIFRRAVNERTLEDVASADPRTLGNLAERSLLERTVAGGFEMHDLVREFVGSQISDAKRRRLHSRAASTLLRASDPRERWEGVYHLLEAGKALEAAALLDAEDGSLLDSVAAEEISGLARGLTLDESNPTAFCIFAEVLGDSLRIRGHVGPALFQYGHAEKLAESSELRTRVPRILRKMAFLERCRNRYSTALGYLVEARARLLQERNPVEMAEVLREMALAEQALGNLGQAANHLDEAVDLATDLPDRAALSRTLLALGSLQTRQGAQERGLELTLEGLRVAERSANLTAVARAHIVVGTTLEEIGNLEESLAHYEKGGEIARLLGNLRLTAYAALGRTGALIELRRFHEAGNLVQEAGGYFETLEEKDTLALLKTYEGQRQMGLGHWARARIAWEAGLASLRRYGGPADLALALRQIGEFYMRNGDVSQATTHLLEAVVLSKRIGNMKLNREAEALLVDIESRQGLRASS